MSQQQRWPAADTTHPSRQERQKRREAHRGRVQRSQSRDRLTMMPPTLESVMAGSTVRRRGNVVTGRAPSQLQIPEPVLDNLEQGLESAADSMDSHDGEYEGSDGQSQESQESQKENELERHANDEDLLADWGAPRPIRHEFLNSQHSILTITPRNTQSSSRRIPYRGRRTLAPRSILAKACSLMWDWTIFVNPFPDPITRTEEDELGFPNFADATPPSSDQIRAKHSGCRSQYLYTAKKAITELYKLDIDDPTGCGRRVEYLLEGDRFTCPPNNYESVSLRFVAPQIPNMIYAQFYASTQRKSMKDEGFMGKIDGPFIYLTVAILCHSLRCWRTGIFIDNVAFTHASSSGTHAGDKGPNGKTGLLERQKQTWESTGEVWRGRIIERIRRTLEARIAKECGKRVERTAGYSNDEEALRREFGNDPEPEELEGAGGRAVTARRYGRHESQRVDAAPVQELEDTLSQVGETDPED
ncbi:hypothetical protein L873DRAFT_1843128 [Choiromyces venosus 120613-1]|uniref:DUF6532 domain-containing protein n=1 Tax=Choiromyces venosus 120613-1 TaxID=1336337 RepID=A0A3N4JT10_9PEZI|nr:hypothetical protein L873DRAFT_1843128 [Choiromyces venosus 120613-1]